MEIPGPRVVQKRVQKLVQKWESWMREVVYPGGTLPRCVPSLPCLYCTTLGTPGYTLHTAVMTVTAVHGLSMQSVPGERVLGSEAFCSLGKPPGREVLPRVVSFLRGRGIGCLGRSRTRIG